MAGDVLIRAQFDDGGATTGLARLGRQLQHMERSGASKGLRAVEQGLSALAAQALGLHGPLGRIAEGLSKFGLGAPLMLGAAAGIGAVALAYKAAKAESERLVIQNEKLATSFEASFGGTRAKQFTALTDLTKQMEELRHEADRLAGPQVRLSMGGIEGSSGGGIGGAWARFKANLFGPGFDGAQIEEIQANTAFATALNLQHAILKQMHDTRQKLIADRAKEVEQEQELAKRARERALEEAKVAYLLAGEASVLKNQAVVDFTRASSAAGRPFDLMRFGPDATLRPLDTRFGGFPEASSPRPLDRRFGEGVGLGGFVPELLPKGGAIDRSALAGALAQGLASVVTGAQAGGIGGFLTGAGGALGGLAGLGTKGALGLSGMLAGLGPIGLGVGIAGTLVSVLGGLFSSSKPAVVMIDGYSSTAITQQQQIMQALAGFLGLKIDILSAGTAGPDETVYELGRRARLDGGMRLPPGSAVG